MNRPSRINQASTQIWLKQCVCGRVLKNRFFRKPNPLGFGVLLGFGLYWVWGFFLFQ